jgi:hypothetical protein
VGHFASRIPLFRVWGAKGAALFFRPPLPENPSRLHPLRIQFPTNTIMKNRPRSPQFTVLVGLFVMIVLSALTAPEAAGQNIDALVRERRAVEARINAELDRAFEVWREAEKDFGPDRDIKIATAKLAVAKLTKSLADARLRIAEANQMRFGGSIGSFITTQVRESEAELRQAQQEYDSAARTAARRAKMANASSASGTGAAGSAAGCQSNLAYLASRLHRYADSDLVTARDAVLATNIIEVIGNFKGQGLTTSQAAKLLLEQTKEYDRMLESARTAVFAAADIRYHGTLESALKAIDANRALPPGSPSLDGGMTGSAVKAYIIAHWGKLANREVAIQVACHAARGL